MREVIRQIIATENEAKERVAGARAEADTIVSEARRKARDLVERSRREARAEGEKIVETAIEEAGLEKEAMLALARNGIESQVRLDEESRRRAVEGVIRCVCGLR